MRYYFENNEKAEAFASTLHKAGFWARRYLASSCIHPNCQRHSALLVETSDSVPEELLTRFEAEWSLRN